MVYLWAAARNFDRFRSRFCSFADGILIPKWMGARSMITGICHTRVLSTQVILPHRKDVWRQQCSNSKSSDLYSQRPFFDVSTLLAATDTRIAVGNGMSRLPQWPVLSQEIGILSPAIGSGMGSNLLSHSLLPHLAYSKIVWLSRHEQAPLPRQSKLHFHMLVMLPSFGFAINGSWSSPISAVDLKSYGRSQPGALVQRAA